MNKKTIVRSTAVLTLAVAIAGFLVLGLTPAASGQAGSSGEQKTFTGTISDTMCGAQHMAKDKSPAECTRICVQQGQKYALVVGKTVYTLEGHEGEVDKLAGQRVTVKGVTNGNTMTVSSVAPAKKSH
jgi:hypothetical protein